jgi:hypothetical protein
LVPWFYHFYTIFNGFHKLPVKRKKNHEQYWAKSIPSWPMNREDARVRARTRDFAQRLLMSQTTSEEPVALFHRVADNFTCALLLPFLYRFKSPPPNSGSFTRRPPLAETRYEQRWSMKSSTCPPSSSQSDSNPCINRAKLARDTLCPQPLRTPRVGKVIPVDIVR